MVKKDSGSDTPSSLPIPKSRRGLKGFFVEVSREMKKVSWPTRKETTRLTGIVLAVTVLSVITLTSLSYIFQVGVSLLTKGHVG